MTEEQALCYSDRYPDLKTAFNNNTGQLIKHWKEFGIKEQRNKFCYNELTIDEAECYLSRYPDLKFDKIGKP
jgi:hypothetical protein